MKYRDVGSSLAMLEVGMADSSLEVVEAGLMIQAVSIVLHHGNTSMECKPNIGGEQSFTLSAGSWSWTKAWKVQCGTSVPSRW